MNTINKYTYNPLFNSVSETTSINIAGVKAPGEPRVLTINSDLFLGKTGRRVIKDLVLNHPNLAEECKQELSNIPLLDTIKRTNRKAYERIRAKYISAFIHARYEIAQVTGDTSFATSPYPDPDVEMAC